MIHIPLLLALLAPQAQYPTDTTVSVPAGARLRVQSQGGDIVVKAWDRNQLRVQASHSSRTEVEVDVRGGVVEVRGRSRRGFQSMVDYELTVPASMALELGGMYAEIRVDGVRAPIKATTLEGDIVVRGGSETVALSTVNGRIEISGARGRIQLNATSGDVEASDIQGELVVDAVSGDVDLRRIDARSVDVQSVSGDIVFEGRLVESGSYGFFTHSGDVTLALPESSSATINLAAANGEISSSFPLRTEREGRRRHTYRLGGGSATVDVETFSGNLDVIRASELPARARREDERSDRNDPNPRPRPRPRPEDDPDNATENGR